jgi:hypothetical protein
METSTFVFICYLSILFASTNPIKISICDCMKPVTRSLFDLTDPEYCFKLHRDKYDVQKAMSKPISYKVITTMNAVLKMEGLVCSQWIETKKVTGS